MKKSEIKKILKELQINFNPEKKSYQIIDELVKKNMSAEEMLLKIREIKGISKFPAALKRKYNEMIEGLNLLVVEERKQKEETKKEENTRKLKEILAALEKDSPKEESISKEDEEEKIKESLGLIKRKKRQEDPKEDKETETPENNVKPKDKKTFNILLFLVALSIIAIILIFLFY